MEKEDPKTAWLLRGRPTAVPRTGPQALVHFERDPSLACLEPFVPKCGPREQVPFLAQIIGLTLEENIELSTHQAFHQHPFNPAAYARDPKDFIRPPNGRRFAPEIFPRGQGKQATTWLCWHTVTPSHKSATLYQRYRPWFMVQLEPEDNESHANLRRTLEQAPRWLKIDEEELIVTEDTTKFPLCGWQPSPSHWFHISLPNAEARRHLVAVLKKGGFQVRMMDRPVNEKMRVYLQMGIRPSSHVAVTAGRLVAPHDQISDARLEVLDATLLCLHPSDDGESPSPFAMVANGWDLECRDRQQRGMVKTQWEENGVVMGSAVIRIIGQERPYDRAEVLAAVERAMRPEIEAAHKAAAQKEAAAAAAVARKAAPWTVEGFDFDAVDDTDLLAEKEAKAAAKLAAVVSSTAAATETGFSDLGSGHPADIARFALTTYPLPPSDGYTVILCANEVALFQAYASLLRRFDVTARVTHNGDGFDSITQRRRLMLLTHRDGPTCWMFSHPRAGQLLHCAIRECVDTPRRARFNATLQAEMEARRAKFGDAELSKEAPGIWAPLPLTSETDRLRVFMLNLCFLRDVMHLPPKWFATHGVTGILYAAFCIMIAETLPTLVVQHELEELIRSRSVLRAAARTAALPDVTSMATLAERQFGGGGGDEAMLSEDAAAVDKAVRANATKHAKLVVGAKGMVEWERVSTTTHALRVQTQQVLVKAQAHVAAGGKAGLVLTVPAAPPLTNRALDAVLLKELGGYIRFVLESPAMTDAARAELQPLVAASHSLGASELVAGALAILKELRTSVVDPVQAYLRRSPAQRAAHPLPSGVNMLQYRCLRYCSQYAGLEPLPRLLHAEHLGLLGRPSPFKYSVTSSKQRGDRELGFYDDLPSLEIDTCLISRSKWTTLSASLNAVAGRLKLPGKVPMPYVKMFRFIDSMRQAQWEQMQASDPARPPPISAEVLVAYRMVAEYCVFDSVLPFEITSRLKVQLEMVMNSWLSRVMPNDTTRRGSGWNGVCMFIARAWAENKVCVVRSDGYVGKLMGAFCLEPSSGYFKYPFITASLDVNSLYPSTCQVANLCPSTLILDEKHYRWAVKHGLEIREFRFPGVEGVFRFVQYTKGDRYMRMGVAPGMMYFLIFTRKGVKKLMKLCRVDWQRAVLDAKQLALKVKANSFYGLFGAKTFAIPCLAVAAGITACGRDTVMEMLRVMNEDFPLSRLREIHGEVCLDGGVPPEAWNLDHPLLPAMRGIGGDTDSVFEIQPIVDGNPLTLSIVERVWELDATSGKYVQTITQLARVEVTTWKAELKAAKAPKSWKRAVIRCIYRTRRSAKARQLSCDLRAKQLRDAMMEKVPRIARLYAESTSTQAMRVSLALSRFACHYMVHKCFNKRAKQVGRIVLGVDPDYGGRRLLYLRRKNYALKIYEEAAGEGGMEDGDAYSKQAGMPNIKKDTPKVIGDGWKKLVMLLQDEGLDASVAFVGHLARRIRVNEVPVAEYAKLVQINDPRNYVDPETKAHLALYMRLQQREKEGLLKRGVKPEIGTYLPMVKVVEKDGLTACTSWEHPQWVVEHNMQVDRVYYLTMLLNKLWGYIGMDSLDALGFEAVRHLLIATEQQKAQVAGVRKVGGRHGAASAPIATPTDFQVKMRLAHIKRALGKKKRSEVMVRTVAPALRGKRKMGSGCGSGREGGFTMAELRLRESQAKKARQEARRQKKIHGQRRSRAVVVTKST